MSSVIAVPDQEERQINRGPQGIIAVAATRAAQEVQAAMMIARQNPRDETFSLSRIKRACQRIALAEKATYLYSKGGQEITGPSIRLAEVMAQCWGNIDFGFTELESTNTNSVVQSFCWDLETNSRQTRTFHVPHIRYSRNGGMVPLSDPREVYELMANQAARRTRACILGVIPGDIQEEALIECERTLKSGNKEPLLDRIRKMAVAFSLLGVKQDMIESRLQHPIEQTTIDELQRLVAIYNSIKDGAGSAAEYFPQPEKAGKSDAMADQLAAKAELEATKTRGKSKSTPKPESLIDTITADIRKADDDVKLNAIADRIGEIWTAGEPLDGEQCQKLLALVEQQRSRE